MGTGPGGGSTVADRLGLTEDMLVAEMGATDAADAELRAAVEQATGSALLPGDTDEVVDAVLVWYREGDADLVDTLVDALHPLAEDGAVWLLVPKTGQPGHVDLGEIAEAAPTAGLTQTTTVNAAPTWSGARLVAPRAARKK